MSAEAASDRGHTCASQRAACPHRPPPSISSVFSPSCGEAERYCSFSPPKGAGCACRGAAQRSAHRLPFAEQPQHLHKWTQIVISVVVKVSRAQREGENMLDDPNNRGGLC